MTTRRSRYLEEALWLFDKGDPALMTNLESHLDCNDLSDPDEDILNELDGKVLESLGERLNAERLTLQGHDSNIADTIAKS